MMVPLCLSPDDGRFDKFLAAGIGDLDAASREIAIAAAARKNMRPRVWVRRAIHAQIDRDLAGIDGPCRINGYVYVIGPLDGNIVKVGISKRPRRRLYNIQAMTTGSVTALFYLQGEELPLFVEREAHRILQPYSRGYEWFEVSPAIAAAAIIAAGKTVARQT